MSGAKDLPEPKLGDLRVWWIPQLGMGNTFHWPVKTISEGVDLMNLLAEYDSFEFANNVKPDYANVGGIEMFQLVDGECAEWSDWYDNDTGEDDPREWLERQVGTAIEAAEGARL